MNAPCPTQSPRANGIKRLLIRRQGAIVLAVLVVAAAFGLRFLSYSNDLGLMLPSDPGVQRTMRFLRESNLSREVIVSLALTDGTRTTHDLIAATDQFIGSIHTPLVTDVSGTLANTDPMAEMTTFLRYTPQLLSAEGFAAVTNRLTPEGIQRRFKSIMIQCMSPVSAGVPFMRADPLGASDGVLRDVTRMFGSLGYSIELTDGHFVSKDGRHSLVVLKTPVEVIDSAGARKLVAYLNSRLAELPQGVSGSLIAGHLHTISNEDMIKRDIELTSLVATIAFLLLFIICFRDVRAVLVFVMPLVAVVAATYIAWFSFRSLSAMVVGMSTVIAGIAIDYGIYVYVAVRRAGNRRETIRQVTQPVAFGALTTMSVFAVFFLSQTAGYRQLALLSNLSILFCLLFALYVLPRFLPTGGPAEDQKPAPSTDKREGSVRRDRVILLVWGAVVVALALAGTRLTYNEDITQMDGTSKAIVATENEFRRVWGGGTTPAVLVIAATTQEEAYQLNDMIYRQAAQALGPEKISSLAAIWPSQANRSENLRRWAAFWTPDREALLRNLLTDQGRAYGFAADAFEPFFARLHNTPALDDEPQGVEFFRRLKDRFLLKNRTGYELLSFFPDDNETVTRMSRVLAEHPEAFIVSRRLFGRMVSHAAMSELVWLALLGVGATIALTVLLLRNLRLAILALIPVVTGLAAIAGVLPILGLSPSIPAIIAALVSVSIVSDYGMFMAYNCQHDYRTGARDAVSLAAISALIGAGALLFARHPTLLSVGVTMVTGVFAGYVTSLLVIPPLHRLQWPR